MKILKTSAAIISLIASSIFCMNTQAQVSTYQKTIGGTGDETNSYCIHTSDGNFLVAGTTTSGGAGGSDIFVMKTDEQMNIIWSKTYGGPADDVLFDRLPAQSSGQVALPVLGMTDGGFLVLGHTFSFGQGSSDMYLLRIDKDGNLLWSKTYGTNQTERGISVNQFSNGDILLSGDVEDGPFGGKDVYLVRTNASGNTLWNKQLGMSGHDQLFHTQVTSDGGFIFAGATTSVGAGIFDAHLLKADSAGNIQWSKLYGGVNGDSYENIQELSTGGYIVAGFTQSFGAGNNDFLLTRTDASGNILWSKTYGGTNTDFAQHIIKTSDGGFAFMGQSQSFGAGNFDVMLVKTDSTGNLQWSKTYGGINAEIARSLDEMNGGGYHICGMTQSFGAGGWDLYSIKTDSIGNSGCHEATISPTVTSPSLTTQNFTPNTDTGGVEGTPATQSGNITFQVQVMCETPGSSCASAIDLGRGDTCMNNITMSDSVMWFKFVADSSTIKITANGTAIPADTSVAHISNISLYDGVCPSPTLIANTQFTDETPFPLSHYVTGLTRGNVYIIAIQRFIKQQSCGMCSVEGLCLQNISPVLPCFTDELLEKQMENDPALRKRVDSLDLLTINYISATRLSHLTNKYIIPVVVHIVHNGEALGSGANISDAQVLNAIDVLNWEFSNTANKYSTPENMNVSFCLAQNTFNGAPWTSFGSATPGITRINSPLGVNNDMVNQQAGLKALHNFPSERYLNIWVITSMFDPNIGPGFTVLGYATFPGTVVPTLDGIVIRFDRCGNVASPFHPLCGVGCNLNVSSENDVLVHEAGHYLNLKHTFHGGCDPSGCNNSGDEVCDTPPSNIATFFCPPSSSPCGTNIQLENFMEYTDESCRTTYTAGQGTRMHAAIALYRSNLVSAANLTATGVLCTSGLSAFFAVNNSNPCNGTVVNFTAVNNPGIPVYSWDFNGDGITDATGQNVAFTYTAAGTFLVTLTVTNGTTTVTNTTTIFVTNCTPIASAQGNWYFGQFGELNFSSGSPQPGTNALSALSINTPEACVTQSELTTGNLQFYTDGTRLWNRTHTLIVNNLSGGNNPTQAISVPDPNTANPNTYYLFTMRGYTSGENTDGNFTYSVVHVNGSTITITPINVGIAPPIGADANIAEMITAIPGCGSNFWIIVHGSFLGSPSVFQSSLFVYPLTATGIGTPVVYPIVGTAIFGQLKASPDGSKIAYTTGDTRSLGFAYVLDFNRNTGVISNPKVINRFGYGLSFSPNSQLLYIADNQTSSSPQNIYQYNLASTDPNTTEMLVAIPPTQYSSLQLGPDNKIYISLLNTNHLAVINYPDILNTTANPNACGYNFNGPFLNIPFTATNILSRYGLPNMIDAKPFVLSTSNFTFTISNCTTVNFSTTPCAATYQWNFGDGSSFNNTQNPVHTYSASGTYTVTLVLNGTQTIINTVNIGIAIPPQIAGPCSPSSGGFDSYSVANQQTGLIYSWIVTGPNPFTANNINNVNVNWGGIGGTITLTATDPLTGCTASTSQNVTPLLTTVVATANPNPICTGQSSQLTASGASTYVWAPAAGLSATTGATVIASPTVTTTYSVVGTNANGCTGTAQVTVTVNPNPTASFTFPTNSVCINNPIPFTFTGTGATSIDWNFGDNTTGTGSTVSHSYISPGQYLVIVTATNSFGCTATTSQTIAIAPNCCALTVAYDDALVPDVLPGGGIVTIWNVNYKLNKTVTVPANAILFIPSGITIEFGPFGKIIVENGNATTGGGQFAMNSNSKLTSITNSTAPTCNVMWQGVEVWGVATEPSSSLQQGKIVMFQNSTIENAHIGVLLGKTSLCFLNPPVTCTKPPCPAPVCSNKFGGPFDITKSGGVIIVNGANFNRNGTSVQFVYYSKTNTSSIKNSIFTGGVLLDPGYSTGIPYAYPTPATPYYTPKASAPRLAYLWGVRDVTFTDNVFQNARIGIQEINAKCKVVKGTGLGNQFLNINFSFGFIAKYYSPSSILYGNIIEGSTFNKMLGAITIDGGKGDIIKNNRFTNPSLPLVSQAENQIGVFMLNSSTYSIFDNKFFRNDIAIHLNFTSSYPNNSAASIIAKQTAEGGNNFKSCRNAIRNQGDNRPVVIRCNTTKPSATAGEYLYNWNGNNGLFGTQGTLSATDFTKPAGNQFDVPGVPTRREIRANPFSYYAHRNPVEYKPFDPLGIFLPNTSSIACPSNSSCCPVDPCFGTNPPPSCFNQRITNIEQQIAALQSEFNTVLANLDKGQTAQLLAAISGNTSNGNLKNLLLQNSPLSDEVLLSFINKNNTPNGQFKDVLVTNSPVSEAVLPVLEAKLKTITSSGTVKHIREAQVPTGNRTLTAIAQDIQTAKVQRSIFLNQKIAFLVENHSMQQAINLLEQEKTVWADQTLLATYIADSNLVAAQQKFASMTAANPEEQAYLDIQGMLLNLGLQGKTPFEMDSAQVALVRTIAGMTPRHLAVSNACAILSLVFGEECPIDASAFREQAPSVISIPSDRKEQSQIVYLGDNIPNPFSNTTVIPYMLPEDIENAYINIYDIAGKLLFSYPVNNKSVAADDEENVIGFNNTLIISAEEFNNGVYIYKLETNGTVLGIKKMILIK